MCLDYRVERFESHVADIRFSSKQLCSQPHKVKKQLVILTKRWKFVRVLTTNDSNLARSILVSASSGHRSIMCPRATDDVTFFEESMPRWGISCYTKARLTSEFTWTVPDYRVHIMHNKVAKMNFGDWFKHVSSNHVKNACFNYLRSRSSVICSDKQYTPRVSRKRVTDVKLNE